MQQGWIKICGLTREDAVAAALTAGVDAIGFVFAASPRQLTVQQAHTLARAARNKVRCVAVTRHPTPESLREILERRMINAVFSVTPDRRETGSSH